MRKNCWDGFGRDPDEACNSRLVILIFVEGCDGEARCVSVKQKFLNFFGLEWIFRRIYDLVC